MKWLHKVATVVMLVVWLPATSLCLLERAGWLPNDDCCPSSAPPSQSTPKGDSPCCTLASATYKVNDERPVLAVPVLLLLAPLLPALKEPLVLPQNRTGFLTVAPPDLAVKWQFFFRTASPPRAPSLAS
jgi:hypothetical protein